MPRNRQNEDSILQRIAENSKSIQNAAIRNCVRLGIGDDAALFRPKPGYETVLTCDWFLEGTHFLRDKHPPDAVGWKCLARAVSDIAAMGGTPRCFLLSLALPETHSGRWLDQYLRGLRRASRKFQCALAGGDTTRRNDMLISITVIGELLARLALRRAGARDGNLIYVSGTLGEAELGLQLARRAKGFASRNNPILKKHLYPEPRLALGRWLAEKKIATAMMDLSDGLSSDLAKLCAASGVGALLEPAKIPQVQIPPAAGKHVGDSRQLALQGGDDYELLFTVPARQARLLPKMFQGVSLSPIGKITTSRKVLVLDKHGNATELVPSGWDPFREKL
ncbi:MAG TPA: thiamine-phosphate kinase [Candidatus Acidoferrum sp.]|nr:thiamine-phosphate kinase [Candidatus Acidoferrum sp.]